MRVIAWIIAFLLYVFAGAALLAPGVYIGVQQLAAVYPLLDGIASEPFHRYVNRCLLVLALAGLLPFLRRIGVGSMREAGVVASPRGFKEWGGGFVWGFGTLAVAALLALVFQARSPDLNHSTAHCLKHFKNAAIACVVVGFIEELLFRGGLFGALRRVQPFATAALISSGIYALVHFFERPENPESVFWYSGFVILGRMLRGFTYLEMMLPGLVNLTLVGMILALAFERTRAIYFSYGLHAGFIFWVKSYGFLLNEQAGASTWVWGSNKLVDGWASCALLVVLYLVLRQRLRRKGVTE